MNKKLLTGFVAAALLTVGSVAQGSIIGGGPVGLAAPQNTITFDELGNLQGNVITNQFAAFGATFTNFGWDNATLGQAGSTGFAGGDLVNGVNGFPSGPMSILFNSNVSAAAFAAVDQNGTFTISSYLNNVLVETFNVVIPANPGLGFVGFENSLFNEIRVSTGGNAAITIDTLQFNNVPEPSSLLIFAGVGLCFGAAGWRKRRQRRVA